MRGSPSNGSTSVSLNAARDVGGRLAAITIWGMDGELPIQRTKGRENKLTIYPAKGGSYSAITALVNIPATMLGATIYELFVVDSDRGKNYLSHKM